MRYWLTQIIYYIRRLIPLYANDNSKIYSAYSAQLLQRLAAPSISAQARYEKFLQFSTHFIDDISGERVAAALVLSGNAQVIIEDFDARLKASAQPRASILLRKTKTELSRKHGLPHIVAEPLNLLWTAELEEQFKAPSETNQTSSLSLVALFKRPYLIWKTFLRSKQPSLIGSPLRTHYLERLSSPLTSDALWLKTYEDYAKLFNTPTDILIMAENLKFRHSARDLALLDFTYRVRYKKPKVLLFHRRMRIALAETLGQELPEYRGTELTKIFFNPLEEDRLKQREARNKKLKATAKAKAEKREQKRKKLVEASVKRREKRERARAKMVDDAAKRRQVRERDRSKLVEKSAKRRNKTLKARERERKRRQDSSSAKAAGYLLAFTMPLKLAAFRLFGVQQFDEHAPVQLVAKSSESDESHFQYTTPNRRSLRDNPELAIFSVTGKLDPYLDLSFLAEFSRVVILNSTALKDAALIDAVQEQLGIEINLECFAPSKLLIKPYTHEHKTISDFSDALARKIAETASSHRGLSIYYEPELLDEYALTLSDNIYRYCERFYAASLFFETIDKTTPVFFSSGRDNFQFTLAKSGFSKIIVFGGNRLLGQTRGIVPMARTVHPKKWAPNLREAFNTINGRIQKAVSNTHTNKKKSILIATHSRSSLHKVSATDLSDDLAQLYNVQTLDFAPQAASPDEAQNIYNVTHSLDRKLTSNIQIALLPIISHALSDLPLHNYDLRDMVGDIAAITARKTGQLMGHTALYRAVKEEYANRTKAAAILVPGRYAEIRAIAKAFHALNFPTIDIQLLFLSTMARYKAPIASHSAVIDTVTRDFYAQAYNIDKTKISVIGSITRDDDIKRAKGLGRAASLERLGFGRQAPVITLACQPGFETATYDAVKALAPYLAKQPKVNLVIKLHPAQSPAHKATIETLLEQSALPENARPWRVLHKEPFWSIIPATTILVSYFSNVCLQACAFGIPVLSLPGGGRRPDPDFETIGLAKNVKDLSALPAQLDYILGLSKTAQRREPPFAYIEQNPHMSGHDALGNLRTVLERLMKA